MERLASSLSLPWWTRKVCMCMATKAMAVCQAPAAPISAFGAGPVQRATPGNASSRVSKHVSERCPPPCPPPPLPGVAAATNNYIMGAFVVASGLERGDVATPKAVAAAGIEPSGAGDDTTWIHPGAVDGGTLVGAETATTAQPFAGEGPTFLENIFGDCLSYPNVAWAQEVLAAVHETTGLPWWLAIAATTITARSLMFPLAVYQQKVAAQLQVASPKLQEVGIFLSRYFY